MTQPSRPSPESTTVRFGDDNRTISSSSPIRMDFLFSFRIRLDEQTGTLIETPDGLKLDGCITGGDFSGPELVGQVKPEGAGSLLVKPNGVAVIELRFTMQSGDGAVIDGVHHGLIDFGPSGFEEIRNQRMPVEIDGRVTARYQTSHPKYEWLNRTQCVGAIETDFDALCIKQSIYAMF